MHTLRHILTVDVRSSWRDPHPRYFASRGPQVALERQKKLYDAEVRNEENVGSRDIISGAGALEVEVEGYRSFTGT